VGRLGLPPATNDVIIIITTITTNVIIISFIATNTVVIAATTVFDPLSIPRSLIIISLRMADSLANLD
jgi:hypothetical protein